MSSQSSLGHCRRCCCRRALSSIETDVSLIEWLPTLGLYFPSSVKDIGMMFCVAELLLETASIKGLNWRGQIAAVMEDGLRLCLWYNSVFPRLSWILFISIFQFKFRAITRSSFSPFRLCLLIPIFRRSFFGNGLMCPGAFKEGVCVRFHFSFVSAHLFPFIYEN